MDVIQRIAEELSVNRKQVSAAVALLDEGANRPFYFPIPEGSDWGPG